MHIVFENYICKFGGQVNNIDRSHFHIQNQGRSLHILSEIQGVSSQNKQKFFVTTLNLMKILSRNFEKTNADLFEI